MAAIRLLTTEANVKLLATLDDNLASNYLRGAIMEAQEVYLRSILGSNLLDALKAKDAAGTLEDQYAELVNGYVQFYLAYQARVELLPKIAHKAGNLGVVKTDDEHCTPVSANELAADVAEAQAKADYHCYRMQRYLLENYNLFPELRACDCRRIKANLYSAATCGIWLGGPGGGPVWP